MIHPRGRGMLRKDFTQDVYCDGIMTEIQFIDGFNLFQRI